MIDEVAMIFGLKAQTKVQTEVLSFDCTEPGTERNCLHWPLTTWGLSSSFLIGYDLQVISDPGRLKEVFFNLLSNAVKFTDKGEVAHPFFHLMQ